MLLFKETMADNDSRVVLRRNNRKGNGSEQANEIPTTRNTTEKYYIDFILMH